MSTPTYLLRPAKRRRTRRNDPMHENDVQALDAVTVEREIVETSKGPVEKKKLAPIPKATTSINVHDETVPETNPCDDVDHTINEYPINDSRHNDMSPGPATLPAGQRKARIYSARLNIQLLIQPQKPIYLKEFVNRIDGFMQSLLDREALPHVNCSECSNVGRWRCQDCMFPSLLCRKCIRNSHRHEPLHRIECWNGRFFRVAAMWEVGGYVVVRHRGENGLCDHLKFQTDTLDGFQDRKDIIDQEECQAAAAAAHTPFVERREDDSGCDTTPQPWDQNNNDRRDALILSEMDRLFAQGQGQDYGTAGDKEDDEDEIFLDDEDEEGDKDCDDEAFTGFMDYLEPTPIDPATSTAGQAPPYSLDNVTPPERDAFNKHYVRIAHVNGIHHLAVLTCSCRGVDNLHMDLIYNRLVPTSFSIIRTLFTTMALDTFRLANLEMKASAYQYFHLIRRLTSKTTTNVPDLYADLRKVSRAWRWMKKLKWAGFGHKTADPMTPAAGELTIFCPACPQPNKNLPEDWKSDHNRFYLFLLSSGSSLITSVAGYFAAILLQTATSKQTISGRKTMHRTSGFPKVAE
jgi:hypothetical protein